MARLRERFPQAVLIGVSAMSDAAMARKCKGLGADLFIGKPVMPEQARQGAPVQAHQLALSRLHPERGRVKFRPGNGRREDRLHASSGRSMLRA